MSRHPRLIVAGSSIIVFQNLAILGLLAIGFLRNGALAITASSSPIVLVLVLIALVGDIIGFAIIGTGVVSLASEAKSAHGGRGGVFLLVWSGLTIVWRFVLPMIFDVSLSALASEKVPVTSDLAADHLGFFRIFFLLAFLNTIVLLAGIFYSAGVMTSLRFETNVARLGRGTTQIVIAGLVNAILALLLLVPFLFAFFTGSYIIFDTLPARYDFWLTGAKVGGVAILMIPAFLSFAWGVAGYEGARETVRKAKQDFAAQKKLASEGHVPALAGQPVEMALQTTASAASPDLFKGTITLEEGEVFKSATHEPQQLPAAAPDPGSAAPQMCPTCNSPSRFIEEHSRNWCDTCQNYL